MDINLPELQRCIQADRDLKDQEKAELLTRLNEQDFLKLTAFGGLGAALGVMVARYLKLSRTTQVLLGLAGFGLGRVLYDRLIRNPKRDNFGGVNRTGQYEISSA